MSLSVNIRHRVGDFDLQVSFQTEGGVTALFGASGSGKSTVINAVAGLIRPDEGQVLFQEHVLSDSVTGTHVPSHLRGMGYVFQEGRLFPHLTIRQNLKYPGRFLERKVSPQDFDAIVALLGIEGLLDRRPGRLSGGEKQRVAIGRALLAKPRLLLMDEPLAALDRDRRSEVLPYLARLRDETMVPILYVSHSRAEVRALANQVVVLEAGRVSADGSAGEVLGRGGAGPMVHLDVTSQGASEGGFVRLETPAGPLFSLPDRVPATGARSVTIVASDVVLTRAERAEIAAPNALPVTVKEILRAEPGQMDVVIEAGQASLITRVPMSEAARIQLTPGQNLTAIIGRFTLS